MEHIKVLCTTEIRMSRSATYIKVPSLGGKEPHTVALGKKGISMWGGKEGRKGIKRVEQGR